MADPITSALTAIKTASDIARTLRGVDKSFEQAELKLRIADLVEALAEARMAVSDMQDEIRAQRERISELEEREDVRGRIEKRDGVFFVRRADGSGEDGPYCPRCFEVDGLLITLGHTSPDFRFMGPYTCPNCNKYFGLQQ
jgi:hypothetical protein